MRGRKEEQERRAKEAIQWNGEKVERRERERGERERDGREEKGSCIQEKETSTPEDILRIFLS